MSKVKVDRIEDLAGMYGFDTKQVLNALPRVSNSAPKTRADGTQLQFGDKYFNSTEQIEYIYKDTGWVVSDVKKAVDERFNNISSITPAPNKIPRADADGKLDMGWLSGVLASQEELDAVSESVSSLLEDKDRDRVLGPLRPEWFGADVTGKVDSSVAVQNTLSLAKSIAKASGRRVGVHLSGTLLLSPQVYHETTDWRHCVLVEDNIAVTASKGALIKTSITFANRAVIFLVRGDNVTIDDLEFKDTSGACFAIGIGGGTTYDGGIASNRTYHDFAATKCVSDSLWQTISFQMRSTDDGTTFWRNLVYDRCRSVARPGNTSSGNFNFRSDPPGKITDADMLFCKAWNGATASSFNYVGIKGGLADGCKSWDNLYAGCQLENGCEDIVVNNHKSYDDAIGVWVDDTSKVEVKSPTMINKKTTLNSPLHGVLGLNRAVVKITKQGYPGNPSAVTGDITITNVRGDNAIIDINSYGTQEEGGTATFGRITFNGFTLDNDGTTALSRVVFYSNTPDITFRDGRIIGATGLQMQGNSNGGKITIDNVVGVAKGSEISTGLTLSGTSSSYIANSTFTSFNSAPSGSRMEQNCFDANGARPFRTPGGQTHWYGITGSPEGVLSAGPGSTAYRVDTGQGYIKTGTGNTGWKLVTTT